MIEERRPLPGERWIPKRRTRNGAVEFKVSMVDDDETVRGHLHFTTGGQKDRFTSCSMVMFLRRYSPPDD